MSRVEEFTHAGATLVAEHRGSGRDVFVLVHGIGMGRTVFGGLTAGLLGSGRVVAVDLPGYGAAPEPVRTLTIERTADLVAAFIRERLDRPAIVVGHSMGAQVALEVAARHPSSVEALVIMGPSTDPKARTAVRQIWRLAKDLFVENPRVLVSGGREYLRAGPHLRRKFHAMLVHRPEDAATRVRARSLVIRGANDVVSPHEWCARLATSLGDAPLVEIDGHGHETMIRDATPAAHAIAEFVREA